MLHRTSVSGFILHALLIGALLSQAPAQAGNIWDGGGSNNNWTTNNNWNDNEEPANNGLIDIVMGGTTRLTPNVNVPYDIRGLIFNFDAGAFTLGGQQLTIRAGGILQGDTGVQAINNAIGIEASQTWDAFSGPLVSTGTVNLGGLTPHTLNISGPFSTTINGRIEGLGQLVMFGTLQLSLGGTTANTYVGATVVNSGLVTLNKPASVTAISSNLTIGDGTGSDVVRLVANHQVADTSNVTINSSGLLDLNARSETIANLTINAGSVATSGETFTVNGSLALASGTYTANGQTLNAGSIQVGVNGSARFVQASPFLSRVTCAGDLRLGSGTSGGGRYELFSGSLNLGGSLFVGGSGTGEFVQMGGHALLGNVTNHGAMRFTTGVAFAGVLDGTGSLTVTGTGSLTVNRIRQGQLTINGADPRVTIRPAGTGLTMSRVGALDLGTPSLRGKLDLANNELVVDYTAASPLDTVRQYLASGYNGGAWDGAGINTSMGNSSTFGLGYAEASDIFTTFPALFVGNQVDNTTVLVGFTRYGDANLDFTVSLADFNRLAANFGASAAVWSMGDFNYDGTIGLADFNLLAGNFGLSAAGPDVTPQDWANLLAVVPEPAGPLSLVWAGLLLTRGRNRRHASYSAPSVKEEHAT